MVGGEQDAKGTASRVRLVLAISLGEGWLLELHDATGPVDFLLVPGAELDLLAAWSDELLAAHGMHRCGNWTSAAATFGFTAPVTARSRH